MYGANLAQAAPRSNHLRDNLVSRLRRSISLKKHGQRNNQKHK
jgi:hypothetical protein